VVQTLAKPRLGCEAQAVGLSTDFFDCLNGLLDGRFAQKIVLSSHFPYGDCSNSLFLTNSKSMPHADYSCQGNAEKGAWIKR